jgi:hypothetical protein
MRVFKIPFVVEEEEKVFGGYISIRQALYIFFCLIGVRIFWLNMSLGLKITLFILYTALMMSFAFLKVNGVFFDSYVMTLIKYLTRKKKYMYGEER